MAKTHESWSTLDQVIASCLIITSHHHITPHHHITTPQHHHISSHHITSHHLTYGTKPLHEPMLIYQLTEWRSGSVSALPCEQPVFSPRTRLREIIPANNCTMQGQNNWGNWGSPGVMKLWVAWEVLRWLMKFRELCSGGFHPKLVSPSYHGFLNVNTPPNSQNSKRH